MGRRHRSQGEYKTLLTASIVCIALSTSLAGAAALHMLFGEPVAVLIVVEGWIVWGLVAPVKRLTRRRQQTRPRVPNDQWLRQKYAASTRHLEMSLSKQRGYKLASHTESRYGMSGLPPCLSPKLSILGRLCTSRGFLPCFCPQHLARVRSGS